MASPTYIDTTESTTTSWTTTHTVTLPSCQAAQHLLLLFGINGLGGTISAPTGAGTWEPVLSVDLNSNQKWRGWILECDGTEPSSVTITTGSTNQSAAQVIRLSGGRTGVVEGTTWDVEVTGVGYGTTPNPPSVTATWSGADNLFVAAGFAAGSSPTVSAYPAGYSNGTDTTALGTVMSATKAATADTDDPATFTLSGSNNMAAATIVIRNSAGAVAGAEVATGTGTGHDTTIDPPTVTATAETATGTGTAHFVTTPNVQVPSDVTIEWDLDGDDDFDETEEDITGYVLEATCRRGKDYGSQVQGKSVPGEFRATLDNTDNRFTLWNDSSPLNTSPFSLITGRRLRVRDSSTTPTEPTELVRDRFGGNGALSTTDTGETWTARTGTWSEFGGEAIADGPPNPSTGTDHIVTVPVGASAYYAQISVPERDTINQVGMIVHYTDTNNYVRVSMGDGTISLIRRLAGVETTLATAGVENRTQVAYGVTVTGGGSPTATVYVDGVETIASTALTSITSTSTFGLWGRWYSQRPPRIDEVYIWDTDRRSIDTTGLIGTFRVSEVFPFVDESRRRRARLVALGPLGQMDRPISPPASTGPDDVQSAGIKTGHVVGNTLNRLGALHPPGPIDDGDIALGSVGFNRQRAIGPVRQAEQTELGFVYETPDGTIGFQARSYRDGSAVTATFSDDPTVLGLRPEFAAPRDWRGDIINRVRSEVSPSLPRQIVDQGFNTDFNVTNTGTRNDIDITIPTEGTGNKDAAVGDLLVVFLASTVQADGTSWNTPTGWTPLRQGLTDEFGTRVFARKLVAGDFGDTVQFYTDDDLAGGGWVALLLLVKNWYGVIEGGVVLSEVTGYDSGSAQAVAGTNDPPVIFTPWPIGPTLFMPIRAGIGAESAGATIGTVSDDMAPDGFDSLGSHSVDGVANNEDVGIQWCRRIRTAQVVDPGPFGGQFANYTRVEAMTLAVRGFAGSPPPESGGFGVVDNNDQSQRERGAVLDHPNPGLLFEDEATARTYNDRVLTMYDQDRPIVALRYTVTKDRKYRDHRLGVQLSDRVRVDLDGTNGLAFDREFFVETIVDEFTHGTRRWRTTYELSPAADPGGGADS